MKDKLGIELKIGDMIVFAKGGQQDNGLYYGAILDIKEYEHKEGYQCQVRNLENGIKMQNWKNSSEVLSVEIFKETNPELFITLDLKMER
jgi:hypothetical protein